jgi:hypothetical protein
MHFNQIGFEHLVLFFPFLYSNLEFLDNIVFIFVCGITEIFKISNLFINIFLNKDFTANGGFPWKGITLFSTADIYPLNALAIHICPSLLEYNAASVFHGIYVFAQ